MDRVQPKMDEFTFVHSSDFQIGMTRHFLDPTDAGPRFAQDRIDAIETLGAIAAETGARCIVVAGDVFESNQLGEQVIARAMHAMSRLPVPIILLPGNHDPLDAASVFDAPGIRAAPGHVFVVRSNAPFRLPGLPGVEFVGAPWFSKRPSTDPCAAMLAGLAPVEEGFRIAIAHGQTSDQAPDASAPGLIDLGLAEAAVRDGRIHYLALGDRHSTTGKGSTGAVWYSGAPVATDFDEQASGNALVVTLRVEGPPQVTARRVGGWLFDERHFDINDETDIAAIEDWFAGHAAPARTVAQLSMSGTVNLRAKARIDALIDSMATSYASVRIHARYQDLVVAPDQLDNDSVGLSGYARAAWEELVAGAAGSDAAARVDRDALALFYRLAGGADR
jgi:DNA repair exonuclease SbcCD nuclease subunit